MNRGAQGRFSEVPGLLIGRKLVPEKKLQLFVVLMEAEDVFPHDDYFFVFFGTLCATSLDATFGTALRTWTRRPLPWQFGLHRMRAAQGRSHPAAFPESPQLFFMLPKSPVWGFARSARWTIGAM